MNIYVGNLSYEVTEEDLQEAFRAYGEVASAKVIKDTYTGRSRGFGFVELSADDEARSAIKGLNGSQLKGRTLRVSEARARSQNRRGRERQGGARGARGGGGRGDWRRY